MNAKFAFPEFIKDSKKVLQFYNNLSPQALGKDTFSVTSKLASLATERQFGKYWQPVDKEEWITNPSIVNAFYEPTTNECFIPAGILSPPFFHPDFPLNVNYGGIGAVIGHGKI